MELNRAQLIDTYFGKIQNEEIDFSQMRPALQDMGVEDNEIGIIVKQVDKQLQQYAINKASHSLGKNIYYGGLIFSLIGVIITLGTIFRIFDAGTYIIIAYGPIVSGLAIAGYGRSKMYRGR